MALDLSEGQALLQQTFSDVLDKESPPDRVRNAEPLGCDQSLWDRLVAMGVGEHGGSRGSSRRRCQCLGSRVARRR